MRAMEERHTILVVTMSSAMAVALLTMNSVESFSVRHECKTALKLNNYTNISTTIHAMTKSFVPFCSAQDGESTDMNHLVF